MGQGARLLALVMAGALHAASVPSAPVEANGGPHTVSGASVLPSPVLTISQSPMPHYVGDPVTIAVSASPVPDGGTISLFYGDSEDRINKSLGSKPIGGAHGGTATFSATFAPEAGFQMKATYSGTATYGPSESATFVRAEIGPPIIWWTHTPYVWWFSATADFAFRSLDDWYWQPAVSFQCKVDSGSWQACTSPRTVGPLPDGPHTFYVRGIDANGRMSMHPAEWEWRIDTQPPTLSVVANNGQPYVNRDMVRIDLIATDQWYVNHMIGYNKLVLDGNGVLANPTGYDQFKPSFEWPFTDPIHGGSAANGTKTVYFQVSDPFGHWSTVASASFIYDSQPPTVGAPTVLLPTGKTSGSGIPVRVSWPAASDTRSGIAQYQLQRSTNGGPWALVSLSSDLARSYAQSLARGNTYAFRVRARDGAGNWSAWIAGPTFRPVLRQEKNAAISYSGSWPRKSLAGAWGGYVKRGKAAGASASITFIGTAIGWVSTRAPKRGQARIYVDGVLDTTIDLYAASRSTRNLVWQKSWPTAASHKIEIRVVGTADRPKVDLDAFVVLAAP